MDLYQVCSNYATGTKNGPAPGHMLYIGLHSEKHDKILWSETIRPRVLIIVCSITLWTSLYQVCLNYAPGAKNGTRPRGHMLYSEKHEKIFLTETIMPRVLIIGMYHHLVDLYQVCSNYAPGAKSGPAPGVPRDLASFQQITIYNSGEQFRATWPSCF